MKKNQLVIVGIGIVILLIIGGIILVNRRPQTKNGSNSENNGGSVANILTSGKTAKAAYKTALIEAKKRNGDAYLVDINARVNDKGESENWYAEFYSPSLDKILRVIIKSGQVTEIQEKESTKKNPVGENWIDIDKIMSAALKECGQVTENTYFASLDSIQTLSWSVNCTVGENKTLYVDFDGVTGNFIKTRKGGVGW